MEMSLFLHNNSAEMRETEGNYAGKKQRHGNEFISVWISAEMRETEGKSSTNKRPLGLTAPLSNCLCYTNNV